MLKGYHKLPAEHAFSMSFDLRSGDLQNWRYWQLPNLNKEPGSREESSLPEELESLLKDAVSRQMVADVPVGILLSGGIETKPHHRTRRPAILRRFRHSVLDFRVMESLMKLTMQD